MDKLEKLKMMKRHFEMLIEQKSEHVAILEIRSHAAWYLKGISGTSELKNQIFKIQNKDEFLKCIDTFIKENLYES